MSQLSAGYDVVFKNVSVKIDQGTKEILKGISGVGVSGEILAVMGPSGAGKSTLLNAIAGRKPLDRGSVTLNGRPLTKQMRRKIFYVLQHDTFLSELTFWDTLWYTALLRLPESMPEKEKKKRTEEIIDVLDMHKCVKTIIGDATERGLSGGEKKRANIACELLTNPALMLLDEPTSGLDSATAFSLISTLKEFAKYSGKTVITTIHQPSSQIFNMFDKLLLLCEGEVVYYGEVSKCAEFFAEIGLPCPPNYNLADHILDTVKDPELSVMEKVRKAAVSLKFDSPTSEVISEVSDEGFQTSVEEDEVANSTGSKHGEGELTSVELKRVLFRDGEVNEGFLSTPDEVENGQARKVSQFADNGEMEKYSKEYDAKWPTGFWLQFRVLTARSFKQAAPRILNLYSLIQCVLLSLFVGICWFQTKPEEDYLSDRLGVTFYLMLFLSFQSMTLAVRSFPIERPVVNKERASGYYRLSSYYLAKTFSELVLSLVIPIIFFTISYWMAGLNNQFVVYIQMLGVLLLSVISGYSIGLVFRSMIKDFRMALIWSQTVIMLLMLAGGFYVQNLPSWIQWFQYLSFIQYCYFAMVTIDFNHIDIMCASNSSRYCPDSLEGGAPGIIDREVLLSEYTKKDEGWLLWHNIVTVVGLIVVMRTAVYVILKVLNKPKTV